MLTAAPVLLVELVDLTEREKKIIKEFILICFDRHKPVCYCGLNEDLHRGLTGGN